MNPQFFGIVQRCWHGINIWPPKKNGIKDPMLRKDQVRIPVKRIVDTKLRFYLHYKTLSHVISFDIISLDLRCVKWRQTGGCKPDGPRESGNDKSCSTKINGGSGFCECADGRRTLKKKCSDSGGISCNEACSRFLPHMLLTLQTTFDCNIISNINIKYCYILCPLLYRLFS